MKMNLLPKKMCSRLSFACLVQSRRYSSEMLLNTAVLGNQRKIIPLFNAATVLKQIKSRILLWWFVPNNVIWMCEFPRTDGWQLMRTVQWMLYWRWCSITRCHLLKRRETPDLKWDHPITILLKSMSRLSNEVYGIIRIMFTLLKSF